jgi:N6-L-threonylcarbamoyladenine synthase
MLCLGIETSCDDTAVALVRDFRLERALAAHQDDVHTLFGGVVPELASREHYRRIGPLYDSLLALLPEAGRPDVIAVSRGPGLLGSLLVGLAFAKGLALANGAALVGVNHLHAHLLAGGLEHAILYPCLGLLVSGGHTLLCRMQSPQNFEILGRTLDDAAGEAFDKIAKMLGGPYPGGCFIEQAGKGGAVQPRLFIKPYLNNENLDFSFSGLKTAAAAILAARAELRFESGQLPGDASQAQRDFCASLMYSIAQTLKIKFERALARERAQGRAVASLTVAGGVAANSVLRSAMREMADAAGLPFVLPSVGLCTDNAAMVAYCGSLLHAEGLYHDLSLSAVARGQAIPDDIRGAPPPWTPRRGTII